MIFPEKTQCFAVWEASKVERREASEAVAAAVTRAPAAAATIDVRNSHVATLEKRREGEVAAGNVDAAIATDKELLKARIALEIAISSAAVIHTEHAAAGVTFKKAEAAVTKAAVALLDEKAVSMAVQFVTALDSALALGGELAELCRQDPYNTPLNQSVHQMPAQVLAALERMPQQNPYDTPLHELRNGKGLSNLWAETVAVLTA